MQQGGGSGSSTGGGAGGAQYGVRPELAGADQFARAGQGQMEQLAEGAAAAAAAGGLEDMMSAPEEAVAGEEAERGPAGNRWPRQETLALLKIRSDMDAEFRDATLKGPLWEDVSRKLGELGYSRSAKKCKEKFENVHKYYKRTKDSRVGRTDGKSYRFFSQLEALGAAGAGGGPSGSTAALAVTPISVGVVNPGAPRPPAPFPVPPPLPMPLPGAGAGVGVSFSSEEEEEEGDEEEKEGSEEGTEELGEKRRRGPGSSSGRGKKMKVFFEGLMRQVMERQEAMQQKFLEAIEKREQDRMIREEAWRRQEMARLSREHDLLAQERTAAAARDATVISFLQRLSGQTIPFSPPPPHQSSPIPTTTPPPQAAAPPREATLDTPPLPLAVVAEAGTSGGGGEGVSSSRWPKAEVLALIKMRSGLEIKYQEAGPKGPLWEEISAGMQRLGYNRSSKRCKEKWENINKYFKKVKESNKKRPEDAKTCPYFHELDALYRKKIFGAGSSLPALPPPPAEGRPTDGNNGSSSQVPTSNGGGTEPVLSEDASSKKPEDIVKELMGHQSTIIPDEYEDEDDEEEDGDEEDDGELGGYQIQFQRQSGNGSSSNVDTFLTIVK